MVYDLYRQAWYEWSRLNFLGGIAEYNNAMYVNGFEQDPVSLVATTYTSLLLDSGTKEDYADHTDIISLVYKSHWEALGDPSVFKKFLRIKIHALDGTIGDFETDKFILDVKTEHDYDQATVSSLQLDFSGGASGWGGSGWGQFIWGESRLASMVSKLASKKAKAVRVVFENAVLHENILITGYELEIASPYDMQIKE